MKHINELGRSRPFNLYNLLPEEISKKEPPIFFIPTHNINCDFLSANLNKSQNFHPDKPKKKLKKAVHTSTTIAHFMHSKKNSTKLPSPTMVKSHISTVFDVSKSREFSVAVPIKFEPYSITKTALFDKGCLTCGKNNIVVEYYGERHVCLRCRNFLKTINDDKASVYLNDNGDVEVVGEKNEAGGKSTFYFIDIDKLWFKDYRCYATLAQENELIVLLHDDQSLKKNRGKKETKSILKEKI